MDKEIYASSQKKRTKDEQLDIIISNPNHDTMWWQQYYNNGQLGIVSCKIKFYYYDWEYNYM